MCSERDRGPTVGSWPHSMLPHFLYILNFTFDLSLLRLHWYKSWIITSHISNSSPKRPHFTSLSIRIHDHYPLQYITFQVIAEGTLTIINPYALNVTHLHLNTCTHTITPRVRCRYQMLDLIDDIHRVVCLKSPFLAEFFHLYFYAFFCLQFEKAFWLK